MAKNELCVFIVNEENEIIHESLLAQKVTGITMIGSNFEQVENLLNLKDYEIQAYTYLDENVIYVFGLKTAFIKKLDIRLVIIRYLFIAMFLFSGFGFLSEKAGDKFFNLAYGVNSILSVVVGYYFRTDVKPKEDTK
jgi:hypothetical protein